jgi:hypothetical protein
VSGPICGLDHLRYRRGRLLFAPPQVGTHTGVGHHDTVKEGPILQRRAFLDDPLVDFGESLEDPVDHLADGGQPEVEVVGQEPDRVRSREPRHPRTGNEVTPDRSGPRTPEPGLEVVGEEPVDSSIFHHERPLPAA